MPGFNMVLGANGNGKCCLGTSQIYLDGKGFVPIEQVVEEKIAQASEIKTLKDGVYVQIPGTKVLSLNPQTMKQELVEVKNFVRREGDQFLYEIRTRTGRKITTTACHPFLVYSQGMIEGRRVSEIKQGDTIAKPRTVQGDFSYHNPHVARLFGMIIGDGSVFNDYLSFSNKDQELITEYYSLIKECFGREKITVGNKKNTLAKNFQFKDKKIFRILQDSFETKERTKIEKFIPREFLSGDDETIGEILGGLYDTDGHVAPHSPAIEFSNKSEKLIDQMQFLLLRFGIISIKCEEWKCATNTTDKIKRKYYSLNITGNENFKKFLQHIPLHLGYKRKALQGLIKNIQSNPNIDLLPQEVNILIKEIVRNLGIKIKPLAKQHPKLRAYVGNMCSPSREGVNEILDLFVERWFGLYAMHRRLGFETEQLVEAMDIMNVSTSEAAESVGVTRSTIRDTWATGKFSPTRDHQLAYYHTLQKKVAFMLQSSQYQIGVLQKLAASDIFWDEIVSITRVPGAKYVYDLTIEGNHTFVAEGLYVHNSNIVDAICFVLGKSSAKGLRAEKSANLIYNGGKLGKPASEAEVSIHFDNSEKAFPIEDKEVKVTRVVKQSGNSTYYVNDKVMTRQQVVDILAAARIDPDGHNIVLQGDIVHFMEMKPVERREIIEDIAGISVFEEKKEKAMGELNKVQERLNEADIILTEREKTLKDLKKDRDQALEYKELEKNIERNKATRASLLFKEKSDELEDVEKKYAELEGDIVKIQAEINTSKQEIQEKRREIEAINVELNEKGDKRQRELGKEIEDLKTRIIKDSSRRDVCENELKKLKERKHSLDESIKEYEKKVYDFAGRQEKLSKENEDIKKKEGILAQKIEAFKKKHGITNQDDVSQLIEALDTQIEGKQRELLAVEEEKQQTLRKKDRWEYELQALEERINKIVELKKEDQEKFAKLKKNREEFKDITKKLSEALNQSSVYSVQLSSARTKMMDSQEEYARLRTKNISIREVTAGDVAIKKILGQNLQGVYGTVADLGKVSGTYSLAMEVAAGSRMKSIVVASDAIAAKCIQYLKENKLGVVTFLPLNKLQEREISADEKRIAKEQGAQGLAIDLVQYESRFATVFKYVLGGTVVVDDITVARRIGIGRARMVTLTGDLMETSGAMIGGFRRESTGGLGFQQKEVSSGMERLEKDMERLGETVTLLEKQKMKNDEDIIYSRERKAVLEAEIRAAEVSMGGTEDMKELDGKKKELRAQMKELEGSEKALEGSIKHVQQDLTKLKEEKQTHIEALSKLNSSELNKELEAFEVQKQGLREQHIMNDSEKNSLQNQSGLYASEKEKVLSIMKNIEKEFEAFSKELKALHEELRANEDILKIKEKNQKQFYAEYKQMFEKRAKCEEFIQKRDGTLIRSEERIRAVEGRRNDISIKKAVLGGEVEGLKKEFEQYGEVQLRRGIALPDLLAEIKNFENMLRTMGNVNLRALEIYEKVDQEYTALMEKFGTLKLEKDDVLKMMFEIESKKQESFMKTFKLLERNFKEIFSSLSTKGEAELIIENPENVFEGGVDIRVRIVGSKYLDIKSLSGGEKTLTALSFIFAIQEFEPSWFYLMDEVDAALDKKNSELLSKLISKYSKGAQYIVISHNDAIISEAETIYGVTMQDGISKVVSLKV